MGHPRWRAGPPAQSPRGQRLPGARPPKGRGPCRDGASRKWQHVRAARTRTGRQAECQPPAPLAQCRDRKTPPSERPPPGTNRQPTAPEIVTHLHPGRHIARRPGGGAHVDPRARATCRPPSARTSPARRQSHRARVQAPRTRARRTLPGCESGQLERRPGKDPFERCAPTL